MKNNITSILSVFIMLAAFPKLANAQVNVEHPNMGEKKPLPENFETMNKERFHTKRVESHWFDFIDEARDLGETYTYYTGSYLWQDSLPVKPFTEGAEHNGSHGGGLIFDPASDFWRLNSTGDNWTRHTSYSLDSIYIPFKYYNFGTGNDSVVISIHKVDNMRSLIWLSNDAPTYSVPYMPSTNTVIDADQKHVVYLDSTQNTTNFFRTTYATYVERGIELPINMDVYSLPDREARNNLCAVTVQFFGHTPVSLGDTMTYNDSMNLDSTNMSLFSLLNMEGSGSVTVDEASMNHGIYIFSSRRYSTEDTTWLYPYNPPASNKFFNYVQFKITGNNVGIEKINNQVAFALSPNPISRNQIMHADFKLAKASSVSIEIKNIQGQSLQTIAKGNYVAGEHLIDADISALQTGVYMYSIETEYGSTTKKFIVN